MNPSQDSVPIFSFLFSPSLPFLVSFAPSPDGDGGDDDGW